MPEADQRTEVSGTDSEIVDRYLRAIDPRHDSLDLDEFVYLEHKFIRCAARFARLHGISHGAWTDSGVSSVILEQAGIDHVDIA